jgi:vacuolar-type H+-ATPase subunit H
VNGAKDEAKKQAGNAKEQAEQTGTSLTSIRLREKADGIANKAKDEAKKQAGSVKDQAEQTGTSSPSLIEHRLTSSKQSQG